MYRNITEIDFTDLYYWFIYMFVAVYLDVVNQIQPYLKLANH